MNILPLFIPFYGCNNRCIYCDQTAITGIQTDDIIASAREQLVRWKIRNSRWDEVAFYGGNFGNLPRAMRAELYKLADNIPTVRRVPLRYSTCPDSFNAQLEREIGVYNVSTIEFGVQSLVDSVLAANGRGYTHADAQKLFDHLRNKVKLCAQMMVGLYTECTGDIITSAARLLALKADYVRIYPLLVLQNTPLEVLYREGKYIPPAPYEILLRSAWLYIAAISSGAKVIRIGLPQDAGNTACAGFAHPSMGDLVRTTILNAYIKHYGVAMLPKHPAFYGYKAILKKRYGLDFRLQEPIPTDTMRQIVAQLKEAYSEGGQWFTERENIEFARIVSSAPYSG